MSNQTGGIVIQGNVRGVGTNQKDKPFVQLEVPTGHGGVELFKVGTKTNGQKIGDNFQCKVAPNVFDGKFYGFREV